MSQTTMAPTIAVQTTTAGSTYDPSRSIKHAWNKGMKRNPGGGGPGGNPGGGGGRGQPPSPLLLAFLPPSSQYVYASSSYPGLSPTL